MGNAIGVRLEFDLWWLLQPPYDACRGCGKAYAKNRQGWLRRHYIQTGHWTDWALEWRLTWQGKDRKESDTRMKFYVALRIEVANQTEADAALKSINMAVINTEFTMNCLLLADDLSRRAEYRPLLMRTLTNRLDKVKDG